MFVFNIEVFFTKVLSYLIKTEKLPKVSPYDSAQTNIIRVKTLYKRNWWKVTHFYSSFYNIIFHIIFNWNKMKEKNSMNSCSLYQSTL